MNTIYTVAGIPYSAELYHFGIPGMKWGVRHEKEPVGRTGKFRDAASTRRSNMINSTNSEERKAQRRKRIKTAVKVGAVVGGSLLAAYGVKKLSESYANTDFHINMANKRREYRRNKEKQFRLENMLRGEQNRMHMAKPRRNQNRLNDKLDRKIQKAGGLEAYFTKQGFSMASWDTQNPIFKKKVSGTSLNDIDNGVAYVSNALKHYGYAAISKIRR